MKTRSLGAVAATGGGAGRPSGARLAASELVVSQHPFYLNSPGICHAPACLPSATSSFDPCKNLIRTTTTTSTPPDENNCCLWRR